MNFIYIWCWILHGCQLWKRKKSLVCKLDSLLVWLKCSNEMSRVSIRQGENWRKKNWFNVPHSNLDVYDTFDLNIPFCSRKLFSSWKLYFSVKIILGEFEFEELDGRQKESVPITDAGHLSTRMKIFLQ